MSTLRVVCTVVFIAVVWMLLALPRANRLVQQAQLQRQQLAQPAAGQPVPAVAQPLDFAQGLRMWRQANAAAQVPAQQAQPVAHIQPPAAAQAAGASVAAAPVRAPPAATAIVSPQQLHPLNPLAHSVPAAAAAATGVSDAAAATNAAEVAPAPLAGVQPADGASASGAPAAAAPMSDSPAAAAPRD